LRFLFLVALKLGFILHWRARSALQGFGARIMTVFPGNANLPIGDFRNANREIGVPGGDYRDISPGRKANARMAPRTHISDI